MKDRSWLLNAAAIASAKNCIRIIQREFGLKLSMSDEEFVTKVARISRRMETPALTSAFEVLQSYADPENNQNQHASKDRAILGDRRKGARNNLVSKLNSIDQLHREQAIKEARSPVLSR